MLHWFRMILRLCHRIFTIRKIVRRLERDLLL
ncbi:hypothetical protein CsSME_00029215 [Camellia sinensis var. sinensis]